MQHRQVVKWVLGFLCLLLQAEFSPAWGTVEAQSNPAVERAVERGLNSLRRHPLKFRAAAGLVAYTLLTGGDTSEGEAVRSALDLILQKFDPQAAVYRPSQHHLYEAAIDIMALEKADREKYQAQIQQIVNYIVGEQRAHGGWFYPGPSTDNGDTSITQYAILGLWAGQRAGITIPVEVLAKAAEWHKNTQRQDGGFTYHPGGPQDQSASTGTMSTAGCGSMGVLDLLLFGTRPRGKGNSGSRLKFGILERATPDDSLPETPAPRELRPQIQQVVDSSGEWMRSHFEQNATSEHAGFRYYYYYTLERAATVNHWEKIGTHDWYQRGVEVLLPLQAAEGHWPESPQRTVDDPCGTCFSLLFLMRATQKLLPTRTTTPPLGEGVLAGGRGLPDDLSTVEFRNGRVETDQPLGEFDQMLTRLSAVPLEPLTSPKETEELVDLSQPEQLIGKVKLLAELVQHKNPRVRQVAVWALGRSDQLQFSGLLVEALRDADLEVAIEARLALCWLARRPTGWGHPPDPRASMFPDANSVPSQQAIEEWQSAVHRDWKKWYLKQRPYELRDDFEDPRQQSFRK